MVVKRDLPEFQKKDASRRHQFLWTLNNRKMARSHKDVTDLPGDIWATPRWPLIRGVFVPRAPS